MAILVSGLRKVAIVINNEMAIMQNLNFEATVIFKWWNWKRSLYDILANKIVFLLCLAPRGSCDLWRVRGIQWRERPFISK